MTVIKHTKKYGVYHWDTFDDEYLKLKEFDGLDEAVEYVEDHYKGRIDEAKGADQVDIVNLHKGGIVRRFKVI